MQVVCAPIRGKEPNLCVAQVRQFKTAPVFPEYGKIRGCWQKRKSAFLQDGMIQFVKSDAAFRVRFLIDAGNMSIQRAEGEVQAVRDGL